MEQNNRGIRMRGTGLLFIFKITLKLMCTRLFCTPHMHVGKCSNLLSFDGLYRHRNDGIYILHFDVIIIL